MIHVTFRGGLDRLTGGARGLEANGDTVGDVLHDLCARYDGLQAHLFHPTGRLKGHLFVARNGDRVHLEDPVDDGDDLDVLLATAGGAP